VKVNSLYMLSAAPIQSNPAPKLAVVAGTRIVVIRKKALAAKTMLTKNYSSKVVVLKTDLLTRIVS
jgi:hypothetical protein